MGRYAIEIDDDLLIVSLTRPGEIITGMLNAAVSAPQLPEPYDIGYLIGLIEQHARGV